MTRPRTSCTRFFLIGVGFAFLWACNGDDNTSASTTESTPAPTIAAQTTSLINTPPTKAAAATTAPTTGVPSTAPVVPPTTVLAPTTTISGSPEEVAKAEVLQTLDAFWADVDACFAAPNECDSERIVDNYTDGNPENPIVQYLNNWVSDLRELDQWVAKPELITYDLREVQVVDATFIVTAQCITDSSMMVGRLDAATTVLDSGTGYAYFRFNWHRLDEQWLIDGASYGNIQPGTTNPCDF